MKYIIAILIATILANAWLPSIVDTLASLDKAGFTFGAVIGFTVVLVVGFFFLYRLAWNARGDYDEQQAIDGIRKKNQSAKM